MSCPPQQGTGCRTRTAPCFARPSRMSVRRERDTTSVRRHVASARRECGRVKRVKPSRSECHRRATRRQSDSGSQPPPHLPPPNTGARRVPPGAGHVHLLGRRRHRHVLRAEHGGKRRRLELHRRNFCPAVQLARRSDQLGPAADAPAVGNLCVLSTHTCVPYRPEDVPVARHTSRGRSAAALRSRYP